MFKKLEAQAKQSRSSCLWYGVFCVTYSFKLLICQDANYVYAVSSFS